MELFFAFVFLGLSFPKGICLCIFECLGLPAHANPVKPLSPLENQTSPLAP